jgi:uncharacterized protein
MALLEKWLRVRRSKLPKAGKGLFTTKVIAKGERIVEYKGKIEKWKDVKYEDATNGYLLHINNQTVIDGRPSKTFGRYANDAHGFTRVQGLRNNSEYVTEGRRCFIEATRNIAKGDEIFVGYGRAYWALDRKTRKEEGVEKKIRK